MKLNKRILAFVLTLAMAFNMAIPAFAAPASSEAAEAAPGEQVTLEFVYENVVNGFEGSIEFSNPDLVLSIDDIVITGLSEKALVEFSSNKQKFFILSSTIDNVVYPLVTVKVTLTIKEDAVVGENLTVSLNYVYANDPDDIYGSETDGKDDSDVVIIPDYTKLEEAIAEAETYLPNKDEYEVGKWAAFETALAEAKEALKATTQGEVDTATATLRAAMNALTAPDLSALYEQILDANSKIEKQYTKASWQNLQTVLAEATNVYNTSKDQNEINQMTETLKAAIAALVAAPDRTLLLEQIARAEALNKLDYTTETWEGKDVDGKLATAKGLVESDDAEAINAAANALKAALDGLKSPVTTGLETQLSAAAGITDIGYTASSWDKFVEKYAAAQKVYDDVIAKTERSQTAINTAANALENAIAELDTLEREALEDKIIIAKVRLNGLYTVASKNALRPVLANAEDVYANARTQEAIDAAVEALDAAIKALVALPNYEELEKQIAAAEDLINAGKEMEKTIQSWAEMMDAYNHAKDVLQRLEEDASVVNSAAAALRDAITMLSAPDYSAITNLLAEIAGLTETDYTPSTWQALMKEVAEANEVIANVDNHTLRDQDAINAAADELRAAKNGLKGAINYDELVKQITIANGKLNGSIVYTPATLAALNAALDAAKAANNVCEDQTEVDSLAAALADAIAKLVEYVDYTALTNKIAEAEALNENLFTEESWTKLENAIAKAKPALNATTQAAVNKAVEDLDKAIGALVNPDYSALIEAIGKVPTDETIYTKDSWDDVAEALANAKALLNVGRDQTKINSVAQKLEDAINALVLMNYIELNNQIGAADAIMPDEMDYTEDSWNEFKTAYDAAVAAKTSRDQLTVDNAATALKDAIATLVKINREALNNAINSVPTDEDTYTTESWADLQNALNAAIAAKTSREQKVVDDATVALINAIGALKKPDYSALQGVIDSILAEEKYTEASWNTFAPTFEDAKGIIANNVRSQTTINNMVTTLKNAAEGLELMNYDNLKDALENAPTNETPYTTESWKDFTDAKEAAENAMSSRDQGVVNKALEDLNDAIGALVAPDYDALKGVIDSILAEEKYSEASWNTFAPTFEEAKNLINNKERSQTTINNMVTTLKNAADSLVKMDYTDLNNAIETAPTDEMPYTTESWEAFLEAKTVAEAAKTSRVPADVEAATKALNDAIGALKAPDYTSLNDAIGEAIILPEFDYTKSSYDVFELYVEEMKALVGTERTQANIEAAAKAILDAIANDLVKMDYSGFNAADTDYGSRNEITYTTESWKALVEAYDAAVEAKEAREQTALNAAVDALNKALAALAEPDYSELQGAIDSILAEEKYSEASWNTFAPTFEAAKALITNKERTQATINAMVTTLTEAAKELKLMDYSKLEAAINDANALDENKYTTETWGDLQKVLAEIETGKILESRDQGVVDSALSVLNQKVALLKAPDYTSLKDAIDAANALTETDYTKASFDALKALVADKAALVDVERTQANIEAAAQAILDAIANDLVKMDYSGFNAAETDYKSRDELTYTTESWADVVEAYAKAVEAKEAREQTALNAAVDALNAALAALAEPDYSALQGVIDSILAEDKYSEASWNTFVPTLEAAKALIANNERTQATINAMVTTLTEAAKLLEEMDYSKLTEAIDKANGLDENKYTTETWDDLKAALADAEAVKTSRVPADVDAATKALGDAIDALKAPDYTSLKDAIDAANALTETDYTKASFDALMALVAEKSAFVDVERTQAKIEAYAKEITDAIANDLVKMDYSGFEAAEDAYEALNKDDYTSASWDAIVEAYEKAVAAKEAREQTNLDAATDALNAAIDARVPAGLAELLEMIEEAKKFDGKDADYTTDSWTLFGDAKSAAEALVDSKNNAEIVNATAKLNEKMGALVPVGREALEQAIKSAIELEKQIDVWTAESIAALAAARANGEAVVNGLDNDAIVAATKAINEAIDKLDPLTDAAELIKQITIAKALDYKLYTEKSWEAFLEVLANAEYVRDNYKTQDEIDAAKDALILAMKEEKDGGKLVKMDYTELNIQIGKAPATTDELLYSEESWNKMIEALEAANAVKTSRDQDKVDAAAKALKEAIAALHKMNYDELNSQITAAGKLNKDLYTESTWAKVESALAAAEAAKTSRDQAVVDAAAKALKDAIAALTEMNYTELLEQIEAAGKLNKDLYTESTWAKVESALAAAEAAKTSRDQAVVDAATKALKDAIAALVLMDYDDLAEIIERAQALTESKYTDKSWKVLEEALEAAIAAQSSHDQSVVNEAANALAEAIEALVPMNLDALIEQIEAAEKLIASEYTSASWADLEIALEAAKEALTSTNQLTVNEAAEALAEAIADLVKMDYSKLTQVIESTGALNKELYTAESWAALEKALAEAEKAYEYRVQADVDAAVKALEDAIAALEFIETPDVDTSALAELIARAEALDGEKYTAETWAALQSALANAKTALKSDSQQVIDDAAKALSDAIAALKEKEIEPPKPTVDYTELNKAIEAAGKLNKDKWTEASWAVLEAKLADAKAALTSTEQSVVDAAAKALNDAISALEKKPVDPPTPTVDYTELLEQIEAAEKLNKDEWTDATWAELTSKLEAGKAALTSTEQSVVDAAAKAIKDAIAALETKPAEPTVDYTELLEQIARTEGLKEADYTAATWKTMSDALASANAALNSTEQSVVDAATEALKNAIDALEKAPVKPDPGPDPEPEFPWILFIIIIIVVALTGAAVVVVIILKKKGIIKL